MQNSRAESLEVSGAARSEYRRDCAAEDVLAGILLHPPKFSQGYLFRVEREIGML